MIQTFNFDYDEENDSLFMYNSKTKSKASVEVAEDIILDFNTKKELVSLELLSASDFFKDILADEHTIRETLSSIVSCKIDIIPKGNFFVIKIFFILENEKQISAPLIVPNLNEHSSPALAI